MSIENSFCLCNWEETTSLWANSKSEDEFADAFFSSATTSEIQFEERVHYRLASWELLEDFSDWYRDRKFKESTDWTHFCTAWRQLGLMEARPYEFDPINEIAGEDSEVEVVFAALSPESVSGVLTHLAAIDLEALDQFIGEHELIVEIPFSELVTTLKTKLKPDKGLVIFAG